MSNDITGVEKYLITQWINVQIQQKIYHSNLREYSPEHVLLQIDNVLIFYSLTTVQT